MMLNVALKQRCTVNCRTHFEAVAYEAECRPGPVVIKLISCLTLPELYPAY